METTINELFATAVTRYTKRPALLEPVEDNEMMCLTYTMLQQQVHDFCGYLQEIHIAKGDRILLWSASRINWMISYLGTLLAGVVIVPLDVNSRQDFLARIADITEAKYLITTQKQYKTLQQPVLPLTDIKDLPSGTFSIPEALPFSNSTNRQAVLAQAINGFIPYTTIEKRANPAPSRARHRQTPAAPHPRLRQQHGFAARQSVQ